MTSQSSFSIGDTVLLIDKSENPSEWATFIIVSKFFNRYRLAVPDQSTRHTFWVKSNEICPATINEQN